MQGIKTFALVLLLLITYSSSAETRDGNFLLRACEVAVNVDTKATESEAVNAGYCYGLVTGVLGTNRVNMTAFGNALFCTPAVGFPTSQGASVVVNYLNENPGKLYLGAVSLAILAFRKAYPCK